MRGKKYIITNFNGDLFEWQLRSGIFQEDKVNLEEFPHKFKLIGEEDIVFFQGYSKNENSLIPLDELGWGLGCTKIQYYDKVNDKWNLI